MSINRGQLRDALREKIGDDSPITGTAQGGGFFGVIDEEKLIQSENTWKNYSLMITETTDEAAPKGESRQIESSSVNQKSVSTKAPFSVEVESGDSYKITLFSDARLNRIIAETFSSFSLLARYEEVTDIMASALAYSTQPTDYQNIALVKSIYSEETGKPRVTYTNWYWDGISKKIIWDNCFSVNTNLKMQAVYTYPQLTADTTVTKLSDDLKPIFLKLAEVNLLLDLNQQELASAADGARLKSIKRGDVSLSFEDSKIEFKDQRDSILKELKSMCGGGLAMYVEAANDQILEFEKSFKLGGVYKDPDGRIVDPLLY